MKHAFDVITLGDESVLSVRNKCYTNTFCLCYSKNNNILYKLVSLKQ